MFTLVFLAIGLASTAFAQLLYVPAYGGNWLTEYTTDAGTPAGALHSVPCVTGAPASAPANSIATGEQPEAVTMTPNGNYLYVTNETTGSVIAYSVNATQACLGKLAPLATYTLGGQPYGAAIDASGTYLFVAQVGYGSLTAYSINTNGTLNFLNTVSTGTGSAPGGVATYTVGGTLYVYVALAGYSTNNVLAFSTTSGTLSSTPVSTGTVPGGIWDSNGPTYVNGNTATYLSSPQNLIAANGNLYVSDDNADGTTSNGLTVFPIGSGSLGTAASYKTGSGPQGLATDGTYLYVANQYDPSVGAYLLSNLSSYTSGVATSAAGLVEPWGVSVDPLTSTVYVSDTQANEVFGFTTDLTGQVTGSPWSTGANSQPGQFLLAHRAPTPPPTPPVPAASYTSLALLGILLAACAGTIYRKSLRTSSVR